jgi:DNA-directed RNA polymerase subunit F
MKRQAPSEGPWTKEKNDRRCKLIDREIDGTLTAAETLELAQLQQQMLRWLGQVAPLPLEDARRLHQELLEKAARAEIDGKALRDG